MTREHSLSVFVVSGGTGASGEQLARTVLAQFQQAPVTLEIVSHVHNLQDLEAVVSRAAEVGGIIVHSMVNDSLRHALIELAPKNNVTAIDIVGPLIEQFSRRLGLAPLGRPGLYRQLYQSYFDRIEAIEFTRALDDGMNFQRWHQAQIVLVGVSRVGKTPLSLYLSMLGWKVANVPLVAGAPISPELFALEQNRVVGLTIDPAQLLEYRRHRQRALGVPGQSDYTDPVKLFEEVEAAERFMRQNHFPVINVTHKPIESTAEEIIALVIRRTRSEQK